jgi:hypothetical protein
MAFYFFSNYSNKNFEKYVLRALSMSSKVSSVFTDSTREKWFPKMPLETHQAESHQISTHPVDVFLDQLRMAWVEEWQESRMFRCEASQIEETR